jgi:hypothetical protein
MDTHKRRNVIMLIYKMNSKSFYKIRESLTSIKSLVKKLFGILLVMFIFFVTITLFRDTAHAKVGIELLSMDQRKSIMMDMFLVAMAEDSLKECGVFANVEVRAISAIDQCVKMDSISQLQSMYHSVKMRVQAVSQNLKRQFPGGYGCRPSVRKDIVMSSSRHIEEAIRQLERMCRSCKFCRD